MDNWYLKRAQENMPQIYESVISPSVAPDVLSSGDELIIDLGNHYVGYFSFRLNYADVYIDAPVRLCVKFCETEGELCYDFSKYKGGLCVSWLQEEIVNIDYPREFSMPRRYAARYIKIKVIATPKTFFLSDITFRSVTSANVKAANTLSIADELLYKIDCISVNTLKNCMHRVFEDGPKRDRRLWIGDLRLEALTNYHTFENLSLVRRCLYLFAAAKTNAKGFLPGYIYENPEFVSGTWFLEDYALLFVASVCDYYNHTGDKDTFSELYPVIKAQMEAAHNTLDDDGIVTTAEGCDVFIDWCEGLMKTTSLHGVYLYVLKFLTGVLEKLENGDASIYSERYNSAQKAAAKVLYDCEKRAFINKKDNNQFSVHSAVWMILGGVISGREAKTVLIDALNSSASIKPFTPYMHHYVTEALIMLDMYDVATAYIKNYWGKMTASGTDTFYEVYVPDNPEFSPYGDRMINSMCHAWSCTPAYFIRKYLYK